MIDLNAQTANSSERGCISTFFTLILGGTRIVRESDYSPASQLFCRVKKTMTGNYHKLDLVNIDAHTKFGLIMSIRSQDIERKRNSDLKKWPYIAYTSLIVFDPEIPFTLPEMIGISGSDGAHYRVMK